MWQPTAAQQRRHIVEVAIGPLCAVATVITCALGYPVVGGITGLIAWTSFYDVVQFRLRRTSEWMASYPVVRDFDTAPDDDRAVSVTLILHQEGVLVLMLIALLVLAADSVGVTQYWRGSWDLASSSRPLAVLSRHSLYATFGVELKDCFDGTLPLMFWVHHLATFAGLTMCLFVNAGVGLVVIVGIIAEVGSGFYNILAVWPQSRLCLVAYVVMMNAANAFAAVCLYEMLTGVPDLTMPFRAAWATLCILLLVLRTGGIVLQLQQRSLCCKGATSPKSANTEPAKGTSTATPIDSIGEMPGTDHVMKGEVALVDVVVASS